MNLVVYSCLSHAMASETLNSRDGITCNSIQGAVFAFPQIYLPENAIKAAKVFFAFQKSFMSINSLQKCH